MGVCIQFHTVISMHADIEELLRLVSDSTQSPHLKAYITHTCILIQQHSHGPQHRSALNLHLQRLLESIPRSQLEPRLLAALEEVLSHTFDTQDEDVAQRLMDLSITN